MDTIYTISIVLAIFCFLLILGIGLKTDLLREQTPDNSELGAYSFGRFQLWIWTLIICPAFILYWAFSEKGIPDINQTSLVLLGVPISVTVASSLVAATNERTLRRKNPIGELELKQFRQSDSFWTDLITDDKGQLSVGRLQNLVFTLAMVVIYISTFIEGQLATFPEFDENTFALMGISSAGYVLGKSMMK